MLLKMHPCSFLPIDYYMSCLLKKAGYNLRLFKNAIKTKTIYCKPAPFSIYKPYMTWYGLLYT